jgi:NAD(P)H-flavin reductase
VQERINLKLKIMRSREIIDQYLQTEDPMAKAIRQAMREKKMPQLAECITIKTDNDGTKGKN